MAYPRLQANFFVASNGVTILKTKSCIPSTLIRKIYKKYKYICSLCGKKVRFGGSYDWPFDPRPVCGSIDHILPISRGGNHDEKNLRLACKSCNCSRKADL